MTLYVCNNCQEGFRIKPERKVSVSYCPGCGHYILQINTVARTGFNEQDRIDKLMRETFVYPRPLLAIEDPYDKNSRWEI